MTVLADPLTVTTRADLAKARTLALVVLSTWVVLLLVSGLPQITDPFLRHDDYPALLLRAEDFYSKTLEEGRWINYWWQLRPVQTPAWLNYQIYTLGWAVFAAAAALHVYGTSQLGYSICLAALIALSPQSTLISLWFNTLIPGMWLIATYAVLTLWLSPFAGRALLLIFVPLSLLTYSTHPLMLLAICLMREDQRRSSRDLVGLVLLFVGSFALGLLLIYTLNWYAHGIFGIRLAEWRNSNPAESLGDLMANLPMVRTYLGWVFDSMGFNDPRLMKVNAVLILASLGLLFRLRRAEALYILSGAGIGLALLSLHTLMEGVFIPFRATTFVWVFFAVALSRAAYLAGLHSGRTASVALIVIVTFTVSVASCVRTYYRAHEVWQASTETLSRAVPPRTSSIFVFGPYLGLAGSFEAKLQHAMALQFRLEHLTGATVTDCSASPVACQGITPPFDPRLVPKDPFVASDGTVTYVRLPAIDPAL